MQRGRSLVSLSELVDAGLLQPGDELSFRQSDDLVATITESGTLRFQGAEYRSPSTAGRAATAGRAVNGWVAWSVTSGDRASLAQLRARYVEMSRSNAE